MAYNIAQLEKLPLDELKSIAKELKLNKNRFIHYDIRPYEDLPDATKNIDKEFSCYIPWILKMTK